MDHTYKNKIALAAGVVSLVALGIYYYIHRKQQESPRDTTDPHLSSS